jgi:superfamily II DNA or RNA helicase
MLAEIYDADDTRIICHTEIRQKELIKSVPGARWVPKARVWLVPLSWSSCLALRATFGPSLEIGPLLTAWATDYRARVVDAGTRLRDALEPSSPDAEDSDLFPHQQADVEFLTTIDKAILASQMGSGKTASSIRSLKARHERGESVLPCLVVCPNSTKINWKREIETWWPGATAEALVGTVAQRRKQLASAPDFVIVNYESVRSHSRLAPYGSIALRRCPDCGGTDPKVTAARCQTHTKELNEIKFGSVIFDEVHRLKDAKTLQSRASLYAAQEAHVRIGMSVAGESFIELRGGPFRAGWIGPIEDATDLIENTLSSSIDGPHKITRCGHLGIESRGWTGSKFDWKLVKSFVRHTCLSDMTTIRTGASGDVTYTNEHSVYISDDSGLSLSRADAVTSENSLLADDGADWDSYKESPYDIVGVTTKYFPQTQVVVDLSGVTCEKLGVQRYELANFRKESPDGVGRLPYDLWKRYAHVLPTSTQCYVSGKTGRSFAPLEIFISDWAYLFGLFLGNGWVDGNSRVALSIRDSRVDDVVSYLDSLPHVNVTPYATKRHGSSEIRFSHPAISAVLRNELSSDDDRISASTKQIPGSWIISWPESARRELLRGLMDTDGHTHKRSERRMYTTTSYRLALTVMSLLRSLGVNSSLHSRRGDVPGGVIRGTQIHGKQPTAYQVQWAKSVEYGNFDWTALPRNVRWMKGSAFPARVLSTHKVANDARDVFDLEMDGHPSFVVNGVLTHNTGTPIANSVLDLWSILHVVDPVEWPSRTRWVERFLDLIHNVWGGVAVSGVKAERQAEFDATIQHRMRRMTTDVVLPFLPPLVTERRDVDMTPKQQRAYNQLRDYMMASIVTDADGSDEAGGGGAELLVAGSPMVQMLRLLQLASAYGEVTTTEVERATPDGETYTATDHAFTLAAPSSKVSAFMDDLPDFADRSVVVFAVSRQLVMLLSEALEKAGVPHGLIVGNQTAVERQLAIDDFQGGKTRIILVTIAAGGTGITLTAADTMVYLQRSWSLIDMEQSAARCRRIGSERHQSILRIDYVAPGTVEEAVIAALEGKGASLEDLVRDADLMKKALGGADAD